MANNELAVKKEKIKDVDIAVIDRQTYILPLVADVFQRQQPINFVNVSSASGMDTIMFHTYDSAQFFLPPNRSELGGYSETAAVDESNYIFAMDMLNSLASIHHYNPRREKVNTFKEKGFFNFFIGNLKADTLACPDGNLQKWYYCSPLFDYHPSILRRKEREIRKFCKKINKSEFPLILNINLNSFHYLNQKMKDEVLERRSEIISKVSTNQARKTLSYWNGIKTYKHCSSAPLLEELTQNDYIPEPEKCGEDEYKKRMNNVLELLKLVKKPELIIISRSQKPVPSVPPEEVGNLETKVLEGLNEIF